MTWRQARSSSAMQCNRIAAPQPAALGVTAGLSQLLPT
jgi:hypothetical protein